MTDETQYVVSGPGISSTVHPTQASADEHVAELAVSKPWVTCTVTDADTYSKDAAAEPDPDADPVPVTSTPGTD